MDASDYLKTPEVKAQMNRIRDEMMNYSRDTRRSTTSARDRPSISANWMVPLPAGMW